jgi:hypothetical protein
MHVDGQCHCGRIRFEAEVEPDKVLLCHCTDCQQLTGTAFRVVVVSRPGFFRLLAGMPRIYVKTADSGTLREQAFCPDCGTLLYSAPVTPEPRSLYLRVGSLQQRDDLIPTVQLWARSAQGWLPGLTAIPHHDTQPEFASDGSLRS